ncbi:serine proteinase stubble [Lasius niger]|uniref:Serine proteinase stubble n=1 Tax=Lasius niger TaxID=67767 RepID=A0A0J7NF30_LASNI|nr:serine proteinase stubble [Lasius niger]
MRWIGYVATILWWSGIARSLSTLNRGHSYKISPKPCKVPGSESKEGTCMFVWECIKSEGTHVGVCVDTFMFGSCCVHNTTVNTISASHHHPHTSTSTLRPTPFGTTVSNETTRLTASTSSLSSWSGASSTAKPSFHQFSGSHGSTRPLKPHAGAARPLQKRPHAKPTSEHDVDRLQTPAVSVSASSPSTWTQETKRPGSHHGSHSHHHQKTRPDGEGAASERPLSVQPGFKDKLETHNTLIVRLPGKEHADDEVAGSSKPAKPGKPSNQRPFESRPDDGDGKTGDVDLSVQETINRPNVNSVVENETAKEPHPNLNFIHTERPHWATKPGQSKPSSTDFPKPFFSVKTTTYRPISISGQADQRPNFISKPNVWILSTKTSTTTTTGPIYVKQPSTSRIHTTNLSLASDYRAGLRHKTETVVALLIIILTVVVLVNIVIFIIFISVVAVIIVIVIQTNDRDYGDRTNTVSRPRPTKKTTMLSTTSPTTLMSSTTVSATTNPTTAMTTVTTAASSTIGTSIASTVTTQGSTDREGATSASEKGTGSVMTVAAADESKNMQCGVPPLFPRPETRIVGGKDAPFGRWPWQVSVRRTSFFGFSSTHRCGGAVLNENWIATAGHCVDDLLTSQIRIRVGEYDFSSVQERLPYVERGVAKKVVHPKYNFFTYEYDLALVRLESSLTFAAHISPICLPATDDLLIGENATVTGWGRLSEGGTLPSVLQEVSVPIVSNDRCKSMFLRAGRHEFIPDIFLCAGYETGGQDSCQGDSGGPLQVRGKDGRYFLAGIISWGIGCAEANLPGVCTRISKFVPWILKNVT